MKIDLRNLLRRKKKETILVKSEVKNTNKILLSNNKPPVLDRDIKVNKTSQELPEKENERLNVLSSATSAKKAAEFLAKNFKGEIIIIEEKNDLYTENEDEKK